MSSTYVERRGKLAEGAALSGAGKRAAFALFYGPLHHLLVAHIVNNLPNATNDVSAIVDLGCGTGASGVAWAAACQRPRVFGIDRHPWAVKEAAATYRAFGVTASVKQGDVASVALPKGPASFLAAFTMNELADAERDALLGRLVERASHGDRVLIVEPLAGFVARWWKRWQADVRSRGRPRRRMAAAHRAAADRCQARSRRRPQSPRDHGTIAVALMPSRSAGL